MARLPMLSSPPQISAQCVEVASLLWNSLAGGRRGTGLPVGATDFLGESNPVWIPAL